MGPILGWQFIKPIAYKKFFTDELFD